MRNDQMAGKVTFAGLYCSLICSGRNRVIDALVAWNSCGVAAFDLDTVDVGVAELKVFDSP
jgi:hypothetical protein